MLITDALDAVLAESVLLKECWVPLDWDAKNGVEVLEEDPLDLTKAEKIKALLQTGKVFFAVGIKEDIEAFVNIIFDQLQITRLNFKENSNGKCDKVTELVDHIIPTAYRKNASDIHIEQSALPGKSRISFRVDGVCQEYMTVPDTVAMDMDKKFKIMANLNAGEIHLPQNGKIKYSRRHLPDLEPRVATYPTVDSKEDVILRIYQPLNPAKLDELVLNEGTLSVLNEILKRPYGLFLLGNGIASGTTTLINAILHRFNKPGPCLRCRRLNETA